MNLLKIYAFIFRIISLIFIIYFTILNVD